MPGPPGTISVQVNVKIIFAVSCKKDIHISVICHINSMHSLWIIVIGFYYMLLPVSTGTVNVLEPAEFHIIVSVTIDNIVIPIEALI
jgi:hypothetical protein